MDGWLESLKHNIVPNISDKYSNHWTTNIVDLFIVLKSFIEPSTIG